MILHKVLLDLEISDSEAKHLNALLMKIYKKKLAAEAFRIVRSEDKSELDTQCIVVTVRSFLTGQLLFLALSENSRAVAKKMVCQKKVASLLPIGVITYLFLID